MTLRTIVSGYRTACHSIARSRQISPLNALATLLTTRLRFGVGPFNYCLFSLDGRPPGNWREYLTNTDLEPVQRRWNPKQVHHLVRDKLRFHQRCMQAGLPTPALIAIVAPQRTLLGDMTATSDSASLHAALQDSETSEFFFKHSGGAHGHGAFSVRRQGGAYDFAGRVGSAENLFDHACSQLPGDQVYIVQSRLRNERRLAAIMASDGLGTIRAVTLRDNGRCSLLTACLRITVGTNVTDNFSVGSAGNLTAAIDVGDGTLRVAVGSRSKAWPDMHTVRNHPETGVAFEGFAVPCWDEVKALVQRAHHAFPELGVIGWDVAITEHGPVLIEGNHAWDINLLQVAHMRGLRADMCRALGAI